MISRIYIEDELASHPRVIDICNRFDNAEIIYCEKYSEIFNRKSQNFRLQKIAPALILAKKKHNHILPAPMEFGIGGKYNFYFSHMMNCVYDCRYCFLQGMYESANYVLFVNYEDFAEQIFNTANLYTSESVHFFSGYDCDSLALEPVSGFVKYMLPVFSELPNALLELRTKSTQIRSLLNTPVLDNCVVAYSLNPESICTALEHKAPGLQGRLDALQKLQNYGWKIGLRFDPLIYDINFKDLYTDFFSEVFKKLDPGRIHSVSLGTFRLPKTYYKKIMANYSDEKLFASPLQEEQGTFQYKTPYRHSLINHCHQEILRYLPEKIVFPCESMR